MVIPRALVWAVALGLLQTAAAAAIVPDPGCVFTRSVPTLLFQGISSIPVDMACPSAQTGVNQKSMLHSQAHAVLVDLRAPGLSFETSSGPGGQFITETTADFLQQSHSQLAFNANLFTGCCHHQGDPHLPAQLFGLEVSHGITLSPSQNRPDGSGPPDATYAYSLVMTRAGPSIRPTYATKPIEPIVGNRFAAAVTGSHLIVSSGRNTAPLGSGDFYGLKARTVVGLSLDNHRFWIVAVDANTPNHGVTLPQAAALMLWLGATTALNLDGGGSTSLVIARGGEPAWLNNPADAKGPRYVGASFGIHALTLKSH